MFSFIIIGRNEGWKLNKCFKSVFETIEYNNLQNAEVIYVDSKSSDGSIDLAKTFKRIKIFLITGECNAAIARNIGAKEACGDMFFFIDGDMEINKKFLEHVIENNQLKYDCVSGHLDDYLYDYNDNYLGVKNRTYTKAIPPKEQVLKKNGGVFLVKKKVWNKVYGLKTKYKVNEDNDFTIRLYKKGFKTIRVPFIIAKHHTVDYNNEKRMWNMLKQCYCFYPAVLLRDHIFDPVVWKRTLRFNYSAFLFVITVISILLKSKWILLFSTFFYIILFFTKITKNTIYTNTSKNKISYFFERMAFQFVYDLLFVIGFVFFYHKHKKQEYITVS